MGQNFLKNVKLLEKEADYAFLNKDDFVLEIGPGIGNLTEVLCRKAGKVFAIEKDTGFKEHMSLLENKFQNLEVVFGDATEINLPNCNKVVSNLPFNVALPLIFKILQKDYDVAVLICQERLARRICAGPGETGYSRISVSIQRLADTEVLKTIPGSAYEPKIDVSTAILRLRKTKPKFRAPSEEFFKRTLEYLFFRRNQKLSRVLSDLSCKKIPVEDKKISMLRPGEFGKISLYLKSKKIKIPKVTNEQKRKAQKYQKE